MAITRDEFIDKWADRVVPHDGQGGGVVKVVREFIDDMDGVIASERAKERRNFGRKKTPQQELAGT